MLIALATDQTGDDTAASVYATALATAAGAELVKVHGDAPPDEVADDVIETLRALGPELVVLGTHARHGLSAILHGSVGEAIARNIAPPALVVPNHCPALLDDKGAIDLRRIVIPARDAADEERGRALASWLLGIVGKPAAEVEVVHSLEPSALRDACLIVMTTKGHDGVGDVLLGSHTERVIRDAACPVLVQSVTR